MFECGWKIIITFIYNINNISLYLKFQYPISIINLPDILDSVQITYFG